MGKRACIVGAGLGGLAAAVRLREAGHEVAVFEAADGVGGVWRANRHPGCACDVPAVLYQLSVAPDPHWSHHYARQPEILAYAEGVVERFGLSDSLRLNEGVTRAAWDGSGWVVEPTRRARERFDLFVPAVGQLSRPRAPDLPGLAEFRGRVFQSAERPDDADLTGLEVGVVRVAPDRQARDDAEPREELGRAVWADPACRNWYKRADGRITRNWSGDARSHGRAPEQADMGELAA